MGPVTFQGEGKEAHLKKARRVAARRSASHYITICGKIFYKIFVDSFTQNDYFVIKFNNITTDGEKLCTTRLYLWH